MAVVIDQRSVRARSARISLLERTGTGVRVQLDGLDRHASADAVRAAMAVDDTGQDWWVYPTAGGTVLGLTDRKAALDTLAGLANRLETAGCSGTIVGSRDCAFELEEQSAKGRPIPASAVLAFTIDPPYQDGPYNEHGVVVRRWGVPHEVTVAAARGWVDWAVPEDGRAVVHPALVDVTPEDALDVLVPNVEYADHGCELFGSPAGTTLTRVARARQFGEVMLTEAGSGKARIPQALEMLHQHVLPHAAQVDYATVRVGRTLNTHWTTGDLDHGDWWWFYVRQLWSQYVADPNPIQVLTDDHLAKAHDLSTHWNVTALCRGRWLVQAKDLSPWFDTINEQAAPRNHQYLDPDLLAQARHDFGDMILTREIADTNKVSGPPQNHPAPAHD